MRALTWLVLLFALAQSAFAAPRQAPEWDVSEWINGQPTTLEALRGKVVVLEMFQMICPGCNNFSIPLVSKWEQRYHKQIEQGDLVIVGIHTVFELHDYQTPTKLKAFLQRKGIHHLVGVDRHIGGDHIPETMKAFRGRGTPEIAIIDKTGQIQFQRAGRFNSKQAEQLIERLMEG